MIFQGIENVEENENLNRSIKADMEKGNEVKEMIAFR